MKKQFRFFAGLLTVLLLAVVSVCTAQDYNVILLGDVHWDSDPEVYHAEYIEKYIKSKKPTGEFVRNASMWKERLPNLTKAAAAAVNDKTAIVIQLGDLTQGNAVGEAFTRMVNDAFKYFNDLFGKTPFVPVIGNHDTWANGLSGRIVFRAAMDEQLKRIADLKPFSDVPAKPLRTNNFYYRYGADLYIYIDFGSPDIKNITEALEKFPDARYKFIITHGAVVPWNVNGAYWMLYGGEKHTEVRATLRELFLKHNVIVLNGHHHRVGRIKYEEAGKGTITQFMINSVWTEGTPAEFTLVSDKVDDYGANIRKKDQYLTQEYKNGVKEYSFYNSAGYAVMNVSDKGVEIVYYHQDRKTPAQTFRMK